jgi:hypothetical protein
LVSSRAWNDRDARLTARAQTFGPLQVLAAIRREHDGRQVRGSAPLAPLSLAEQQETAGIPQ